MIEKRKNVILMLGIIFTAVCLRGPIASVGSLVDFIESDLAISKASIGFITTMPLLVFAASSLLIPKISRNMGHTKTLVWGMFLFAAGCLIRSSGGYAVMLVGTLLLGLGISAGNVLLPAVIKENMPLKIGVTTGIYLCFQNISAAIGAGFSYPAANMEAFNWRSVLGIWMVPGIIACLLWFLVRNKGTDAKTGKSHVKTQLLWKSKLAWAITMIMGIQSVNYYCITAWLPSILQASDMSFELAGYLASFFQVFAIPSIFIAPYMIANTKNKILPATVSGLLYLGGVLMLMFTSSIPCILIGLFFLASGGGASFAWVVAIIAVVSEDADEASRMSGMAQSIGYLMAAVAPTLSGKLFDWTGNWMSILCMAAVMSTLIVIVSLLTGRILHTRNKEMEA